MHVRPKALSCACAYTDLDVHTGKHCALENEADLCVNEDQQFSEYRVSLAERKKEEGEKSIFDSVWFSM